jgi:hypothetical protein
MQRSIRVMLFVGVVSLASWAGTALADVFDNATCTGTFVCNTSGIEIPGGTICYFSPARFPSCLAPRDGTCAAVVTYTCAGVDANNAACSLPYTGC